MLEVKDQQKTVSTVFGALAFWKPLKRFLKNGMALHRAKAGVNEKDFRGKPVQRPTRLCAPLAIVFDQ